MSTAPLAILDVAIRLDTVAFCTVSNWIEGLTTHRRIVRCRYYADGSYLDRWISGDGDTEYNLIAWRPI